MNNQKPFSRKNVTKMGDHHTEPNFQEVIDVIAVLVRGCVTEGILTSKLYAPTSLHQQANLIVELPASESDHILENWFYTKLLIPLAQHDSVRDITLHMCWNDQKCSHVLIDQIVLAICTPRYGWGQPESLCRLLTSLIKIEDAFTMDRVERIFLNGVKNQDSNLLAFCKEMQDHYEKLILTILRWLAELITLSEPTLTFLKQDMGSLVWIPQFLVDNQSMFPIESSHGTTGTTQKSFAFMRSRFHEHLGMEFGERSPKHRSKPQYRENSGMLNQFVENSYQDQDDDAASCNSMDNNIDPDVGVGDDDEIFMTETCEAPKSDRNEWQ